MRQLTVAASRTIVASRAPSRLRRCILRGEDAIRFFGRSCAAEAWRHVAAETADRSSSPGGQVLQRSDKLPVACGNAPMEAKQ